MFCGKFYLQVEGGPIGLRSTACLASLIMKLWDTALLRLLKREGISIVDLFRYVDDVRQFMRPFREGIRWNGEHFVHCDVAESEDLTSGLSDQQRTMKEIVKAMSSLTSFLQFEGEVSEMFSSARLPTLDTEIWVDEPSQVIMFSFYEKPMCPNRVLQKTTALADTSIRASLTQECVKRLLNCSLNLPQEEKRKVLSVFGQKLLYSGHSVQSSQYLLVHGVVKFLELKRMSELPPSDAEHKPLHCDKNYDICGRRLRKLLAKSSWYDDESFSRKKS